MDEWIRDEPRSPFKVAIYRSELAQIRKWVLKHNDIETGGDLFGLWSTGNTAVVHFVLGPGKGCRRTATSFFQDSSYMNSAGSSLADKMGLCNIGGWHSHHKLGLFEPSAGDIRTVQRHMPKYNWRRFLLFIATLSSSKSDDVALNCFLFEAHSRNKKEKRWHYHELLPGKFEYLEESSSPFRTWLMEEPKNALKRNIFEGAEEPLVLLEDVAPTSADLQCIISPMQQLKLLRTLPHPSHTAFLQRMKQLLPTPVFVVFEPYCVCLLFSVCAEEPFKCACRIVCMKYDDTIFYLFYAHSRAAVSTLLSSKRIDCVEDVAKDIVQKIKQLRGTGQEKIKSTEREAENSVLSEVKRLFFLLSPLKRAFDPFLVIESQTTVLSFVLKVSATKIRGGYSQSYDYTYASRLVCFHYGKEIALDFYLGGSDENPILRIRGDLKPEEILNRIHNCAEKNTKKILQAVLKRRKPYSTAV